MKYLAIIFSVYMILLAVLPCRDSDDTVNLPRAHTSITKSHAANEKAGNEACTPMCTCSCCSMVRNITPYQTAATVATQEVKQVFNEPSVPALKDQSLSIWQPPQLG